MTIRLKGFIFTIFFILPLFAILFFTSPSWADEDIELYVGSNNGIALAGLNVYAFNESGSYTGVKAVTNSSGLAIFNSSDFTAGTYKFRVDYLGNQFWSPVVTIPATLTLDVIIEEETAEITVTTGAGPSQGIRVYLFSSSGSYLGLYENTDADGKVAFDLPVDKEFKFRADILGSRYWSEVVAIIPGSTNDVQIDAGGGVLQVTVEKEVDYPMEGIRTYLFSPSGSYLGLSDVTDSSGLAEFDIPAGDYKVRADYLGNQFWSNDVTVTVDTGITVTISHQDVVITVQGTYQGTPDPLEGIKVYLFSSSGSYLGQYQVTDNGGQVVFSLPEQAYKVRADYLGQQFWSGDFAWQDTTVDIPMANVEVTVAGAGQPLESVKVYVFSGSGSYLGVGGTTNSNGNVTFQLPSGSYNFRADYQGSQYWSGAETLIADEVNPVAISTGGGIFSLTILKGPATPLIGVKCYLFSESGSYLGLYATTDANGQVSFPLANGSYKIRVDYLGNQFWTNVYNVPATLSGQFTIPHQDVVITVQGTYQGTPDPLEGIKVYLFSSSGSYLGQYQVTDNGGQVVFNLPEQAYKVRADYLGQQFWSGDFTWQDAVISIPQGIAEIHVLRSTDDIPGARVYLFTGVGSYLGWYETTDNSGMVQFSIPSGSYKFRADEGGDQKWSDAVTIIADQVNSLELNLSDQPVVTLTADPGEIPVGKSTTLSWSSINADSVTIDQGVGSVDLNGSIAVLPAETTTYTITATGPGGSATDTATVTVIGPPVDIDLGIDINEQQGGGGLVGETIRVLNGNMVDSRSDLLFPSPNRLGLGLQAFYNSRSSDTGSMGYGWLHSYEISLDTTFNIGGVAFIKITDSTGKAHYFTEEGAGEYLGSFGEKGHVRLETDEYIWYRLDGSRYIFSSSGRLSHMEDATENSLQLSYDASDRLETVTDNASGRILTFHYNGSNLLEHVSGPITGAAPDGIWVSYDYDANNNLISITYADGSGFDYSYTDTDDIHNITGKRDKLNHLLSTWAYDEQDRATDNFSRDGKGADIVYESDLQVNVTDAYGKEREYLLNIVWGRKRVSSIINGPGGAGSFPWTSDNAVSWIYDANINPTEVEYAGDTINQYLNYDERGNPGTVKLALGTPEERTISYTFHPDMNAPLTRTEPSVIESGNKETIWDYDNDYDTVPNEAPTALVSRIIEKGYTKDTSGMVIPYEYITVFAYNTNGQVLSIDGPLPGSTDTTTFSYDPLTGDLLSITRPLIGATTFSDYDPAGQVGRITDVNGQSKDFTYDGRGRVTGITNNADSSTNSMIYDTAGMPVYRTDEDGVMTNFEYDTTYGRLYRRLDHEGNYIMYQYDGQGNVIEKGYFDPSDTRTNRKRFSYQDPTHNMPGLLFREINGDDTYTQYGYDLEGNVASVTDPNGNTTTYEYDSLNRLTTVTQPGSLVTSYAYDGHGNLESVTDAESHTTTYQYDDMGRLVSTTSPDTGTVTYTYNEAGNPLSKKDAKDIAVNYEYDILNRLTNVSFPDPSQDITYTYDSGTDGIGRRTGMEDESGIMNFSYDGRGRLTEKTSIINGITYDISRAYTPGGRISFLTYPTGRTIDYHRSTCACRVDSITTTYEGNTDTIMENLTYRPFGGASGLDTGAGGVVGSQFDESGRMIVSNPGAEHERTYTYDNNGNLTSISAPSTPWYDRIYGYDGLNRLEHAEGPWGVVDYTYDDVGNRLTKTENSITDNYTYYSGTNRLNKVTMDTGTVTYTFDLNGNITGIGNKILTYDQNNRLIRVEEDSVVLGEYTYNGLGQRVIKDAGGVTTVFHYDFEGNIIGESDTSGSFSKEYLYRGTSRLALVDVVSGGLYYYGNDQLGTPMILTDSTNTVVWEGIYKPFGEADVNPNSTIVNNFRFPGQYYDQETGLHYNLYRYYDSRTGRYLKPDPSHSIQPRDSAITCFPPFILKPPQELNPFTYTRNNPVMYSDCYGLQTSNIDFIPSPAYQKAIKALQAHYLPIFQKIVHEYHGCIKLCDQLRELECLSTFMIPIYVTTCKLGCFLDYTKDYQITSIAYWIRQTLAWEMYQFPNKEKHYPEP